MEGNTGLSASLTASLIHPKPPARVRQIRLPWLGRLMYTSDPGDARHTAMDYMQTRLHAVHRSGDGRIEGQYDLGSGNVQMNLVVGLMQDTAGTTNNHAAPILANSGKYMYSGTGTTITTYDYQLQTGNATPSGAVTPTLAYSVNNTTLVYVGTIAYTGTVAVAEWGLFNANVQGAISTSTTNTWNGQGQASATWGTSIGTANQYAGYVAVVTGVPTGVFVLSNASGTSGTIVGAITPTLAYYSLTSGGGSASTPSSNTSTSLYPLMSDHKTFSVINVVNGDSIQFTYTLTIQSGG